MTSREQQPPKYCLMPSAAEVVAYQAGYERCKRDAATAIKALLEARLRLARCSLWLLLSTRSWGYSSDPLSRISVAAVAGRRGEG